MSQNVTITTKIVYDNFTTLVPSMMPTILENKSNNDPISDILGAIWIIIQIFLFLCSTFAIMCVIAYMTRIKLTADVMRQRHILGIN